MKWICLLAGGMLGTAARYLLSGLMHHFAGIHFPYGTLVVNVIGCFLIGMLTVVSAEKYFLGPHTQLGLMVGFCGAFTTFSTFMMETSYLIRDGHTFRSLLNLSLSVFIGFFVFRLGVMIGDALFTR